MSRLFTFGCSFTNWNWPTWADLLGYSFVQHQNWGQAGIGNRAIAERVAESFTLNNFTENDVVIVQWSSHLRNDYARTDWVNPDGSMWVTRGSPVSPYNRDIYDKKWFRKFWDQKAYYIHTLNNIILTQQLLKSCGCKWYMTSMSDLIYVSFEDESTFSDVKKYNAFEISPDLIMYKTQIWDRHNKNWLPPVIEEKWNSPELDWIFNVSDDKKSLIPFQQSKNDRFIEPHLTPLQYFNYLNKIEFDIPLCHEKILEVCQRYEKIYKKNNHIWENFIKDVLEEPFIKFKGHYGK